VPPPTPTSLPGPPYVAEFHTLYDERILISAWTEREDCFTFRVRSGGEPVAKPQGWPRSPPCVKPVQSRRNRAEVGSGRSALTRPSTVPMGGAEVPGRPDMPGPEVGALIHPTEHTCPSNRAHVLSHLPTRQDRGAEQWSEENGVRARSWR